MINTKGKSLLTNRSKTVIIPASLTVLTKDSMSNPESVEDVTFERGSQIRRFEPGLFTRFQRLKSICIAASVEVLAKNSFVARDWPNLFGRGGSRLENVTFEERSKLREIESNAFAGCESLKYLLIPASVERMSRVSLPESHICRIEVESGSRYFEAKDGLVIDLNRHAILRYYGSASQVTIPAEIEQIDDCCFYCCASVETVSFARSSKLLCISERAFAGCLSLEVIVLPSSVKTLKRECFAECFQLSRSPLPADSEVVRIEGRAFQECSLKWMIIPSSVEFVGAFCFEGCDSLSVLTFGSPSHLRELLALPPKLSGFVLIPDSVEILSVHGLSGRVRKQHLSFGSESRLIQIKPELPWRTHIYRSFEQVSSRSLKLFRMHLEFTGST